MLHTLHMVVYSRAQRGHGIRILSLSFHSIRLILAISTRLEAQKASEHPRLERVKMEGSDHRLGSLLH